MKIYVGNLNFNTTQETLQALFSEHGSVESVDIVMDRVNNRSRGFAFLEMPNQKEAEAAIQALNGQEVDGRRIRVNKADTDKRKGGGKKPFKPKS